MRAREAFRVELLSWYASMVAVGKAMPRSEMKKLLAWEHANLNGCTVSTSDWPGWEKYIGNRPAVSDEERSEDRFGYVYIVKALSGEYKIGRSKDVNTRLRSLTTSAPCKLELVHKIRADDSILAESILHTKFSAKRLRGEWYGLVESDLADLLRVTIFSTGEFVIED
jgi:hypothetical protein